MCPRVHLLLLPLVEVCPQGVNSPLQILCYSVQGMLQLLWLQKNPRDRKAESYRDTQGGALAVSMGTVYLQPRSQVGYGGCVKYHLLYPLFGERALSLDLAVGPQNQGP